MPLDILDVLALLGAAVQVIPGDRNALTVRMTLAEACDIAIDFLRQGSQSREFNLNEAQSARLHDAASSFRISKSDHALLHTTESAAMEEVESVLDEALKEISEGRFSVRDGLALVEVLDRTRTLLRAV